MLHAVGRWGRRNRFRGIPLPGPLQRTLKPFNKYFMNCLQVWPVEALLAHFDVSSSVLSTKP